MGEFDISDMRDIDIRTVEKSTLVDVSKIKMDSGLSKDERVRQFTQQIKNPYCFLCEGMIVKSTFSESGDDLETTLMNLIMRMNN